MAAVGYHWLHFLYPSWIGVAFFITRRSTIIDLPVTEYITKDNVPINIDIAVTFCIMRDPDLGEDSSLVRKFAYVLAPSGLQHKLRAQNDEAFQAILRLVDYFEVYRLSSMLVDQDST